MIKAILMDFNGVVINDEPIQHQAYRAAFAAEGIDVTDEEYYSRLGMDDRTFVSSIFEAAGKPADDEKVTAIAQAKNDQWREIVANEIPLFPGVEDFIRKSANAFTLGIVSMANRADIEYVLGKVGLRDKFAVVISAQDITCCKPHPECYRKGFRLLDAGRTALGHLPIVHGECLVVEDSPPGVAAAKGAGLPVLGVTNTVSESEMRAAGADAVASFLGDWMPDSIRRTFC